MEGFFAEEEEYSTDVWQEIMGVNLEAAYHTCVAAAAKMRPNGGGSILLTGSIYGSMGPDQRSYDGSEYLGRQIRSPAVYSASKAGVVGLARHFAAAWGRDGIRVNVLTPGGVSSGQNVEFETKYSNRIPLGRMAQARDMCGAALYLASEASGYVTGQVISVDGGLSCW